MVICFYIKLDVELLHIYVHNFHRVYGFKCDYEGFLNACDH